MTQSKGRTPHDKSPAEDRKVEASALPNELQDIMEQALNVKLHLIQNHATTPGLPAISCLERAEERIRM
jgi:hypothetical protein